MTISHAVAVLSGEGIVVSYQGRGVFIADGSEHAQPEQWHDPMVDTLRAELDQLAKRVSYLERQLPSTHQQDSAE